MSRIVMKFGGTSVGDIARIQAVALQVQSAVLSGAEVAVVVSAMSGWTNRLVGLCGDISDARDSREHDVVVSSGEQVTAGLLSLALQSLGVSCRSWLGWQIALRTDESHGSARIESIDSAEISASLSAGNVAVVAGFQGVSPSGRVSTLGRGGSDTSAVALAAALGADRCDIYTDVDGVYTMDPRIVPSASKLSRVTFEEMLELASGGAKVLQTRSVALAMRHGVSLQVLSSFEDLPGTLIVKEDEVMEKALVSGIACSSDEAKITLSGLNDRPGVAALVFSGLADGNVNVDMIVQTAASVAGKTDITFSVPGGDLSLAMRVLEGLRESVGLLDILVSDDVCKISVVGVGMRSQPGVAKTMFTTLAEKGINIQVISTSEIKISVLISRDYKELAARSLHTAFGLDAS